MNDNQFFLLEHCNNEDRPLSKAPLEWHHICEITNGSDAKNVALTLSKTYGRIRVSNFENHFKNGEEVRKILGSLTLTSIHLLVNLKYLNHQQNLER